MWDGHRSVRSSLSFPAFHPVNPRAAGRPRTGVRMTKELFVSSTPYETKVGLVEDDQLAEIYLERENEYTLAGSIYKGRVTRVLPGMQSAFVDIGLERDAFLYVSDFMELEDQDEVEELPTGRPATEQRHPPQPRAEGQPVVAEAPAHSGEAESHRDELREAPQPSEIANRPLLRNSERVGDGAA